MKKHFCVDEEQFYTNVETTVRQIEKSQEYLLSGGTLSSPRK